MENDDNDNYNFYNDPETSLDQIADRNESGPVTGEDDLVALHLSSITGASAGDKIRLDTTSTRISLWRNADKSGGLINGLAEFDALSAHTVYVEGRELSPAVNAESVDLVWVSGANPALSGIVDTVFLTVYNVRGTQNVPGYSKHKYVATLPGTTAAGYGPVTGGAAVDVSGSTPVGAATTNAVTILWGAGEVVGTYRVNVPNGFFITRQVNVVKVQLDIDAAGNQLVLKDTRQSQTLDKKGVESSPAQFSATEPAMYAQLRVSRIAGPVVGGAMRGPKFIDLGFMQTVSVNSLHGDYDDTTPKFRVVHRMEGKTYIDVVGSVPAVTAVNKPWYEKDYGFAVLGGRRYKNIVTDAAVGITDFDTSDSPALHAVENLTVDGDHVDLFAIVLGFDTYFAVHTKETVNAADDSYTIRASVPWGWNATGRVTNDANHTWTLWPGIVTLYSPANPKKFTEVTNGDIVSTILTKGTVANDAANAPSVPGDPAWTRVNQ